MSLDIDNINDIGMLKLELKRFYSKCKKDFFGDDGLELTKGLYYKLEQVTSNDIFIWDGDYDSAGYITGKQFEEYFESEN